MVEVNWNEKQLITDMLMDLKNENSKGHYFFENNTKGFEFESYSELVENALKFGTYLINQQVSKRSVCLLSVTSPKNILTCFYGAISMGFIPLILPATKALSGKDLLNDRINVWHSRFENNSILVTDNDELINNKQYSSSLRVLSISDFQEVNRNIEINSNWLNNMNKERNPDDIAYIQLTSASTGKNKGVAITHKNVFYNVVGMTQASKLSSSEIGCSWLPLYHDMGLVGAELFCLYNNFPLVLMSPYNFLKKPLRWLEAIDQFKCSLTPAPNFAFDYCCELIKEERIVKLDLSSLKVIYNGAEPISVETLTRFYQKFNIYGYKSNVMTPVYGLAENTLAVTFEDVQSEANFLEIERKGLSINRQVNIINDFKNYLDYNRESDKYTELRAFSVGKPLLDQEVYIEDEEGKRIIKEEVLGQIVVKGSSAALGYITADSKDFEIESFDGVVKTGDIGFIKNQKLYVIERMKNVIIRNGENYFSNDLEIQLARRLDINESRVAVFEEKVIGGKIVALIEVKSINEAEILNEIVLTSTPIELPVERYIFIKKGQIPKTTSGKKQHYKCRELLLEDKFQIIEVKSPSRVGGY